MVSEVVEEPRIIVTGFQIQSPITANGEHEDAELDLLLSEAADQIATDIGMALANLGRACTHGSVEIDLDGFVVSSE